MNAETTDSIKTAQDEQCLKESRDNAEISPDKSVLEETGDSKNEKSVLCRNCGNLLTSSSFKTSVNGQHIHIFANPYGMVFEIACFSKAHGCAAASRPSEEFSWFRGYRWKVAVCRLCLNHNGWIFESDGEFFLGLITDQIVHS